MSCDIPRPFYIPWTRVGARVVQSKGDGYTMSIQFHRAYAKPSGYSLAYNIYYSTVQDNEVREWPKFVSTNLDSLRADIIDFSPGQTYFFTVRATEYDPEWYDIKSLQQDPYQTDTNLYIYPESLLSEDIDDSQLNIPIDDPDIFPSYGVIQIGSELIRYISKDIAGGFLIGSERGFNDTEITIHQQDGYDGYVEQDPIVRFWRGYEEDNFYSVEEQCSFSSKYDVYTVSDGYRRLDRTGMLTADLAMNDLERSDFPAFDMVGWRRTDPKLFFQGLCVDSYIGGENFCADGNNGVNQQIRNVPLTDQADRLQEFLLEQLGTGESCMLLRRMMDGITCSCVNINQDYPDARCGTCFGTGYISGYDQFYNNRRSDGRILVRFDPATEDIKLGEGGLESEIIYNCWTLTYPSLKDRDVLIRFNPDGTEEFRYEVLDVTRNRLLYGETGNQHFRIQRVRKTSPIYQWRAIRSTANIPQIITTTVGLLRGANNVPIPHTHTITINEGILSLTQVNETTSISSNHNHPIINGVISKVLGHTHSIIL
jgi:hypothetical protein